jgi:TolA-binding protein
MRTLRAFALCLLTAFAMAVPGIAAHAQIDSREAIDLQNQIAELRQELQMMQQAQQTGNQAPPTYAPQPVAPYPGQGGQSSGGSDVAAELVVRVSALEEQVRDLQGKVDDLNNQLQHQHDDLTKQIGDLEFKLGQGGGAPAGAPLGAQPGIEPGTSPDPVQAPSPSPSPKPPTSSRRTPEMILREGNAALARGDYVAAAASAHDVLANSHGPRLTDAQFLLARAEGAQGQYKESAADYYKAYQRAPKSATGQVALLGVANALLGMHDSKDACEALAKLSVEYPKASAGVKENAAATRRRAGCGK